MIKQVIFKKKSELFIKKVTFLCQWKVFFLNYSGKVYNKKIFKLEELVNRALNNVGYIKKNKHVKRSLSLS